MTEKELETALGRDFDRLRGMILGLLESFNLPEKHERAACQTFKSFTYDRQKQLYESVREYLRPQ